MARVFVAVDPSSELRARLVELKRDLAAAGADVRWARDEGLHCTLKFLGEVEAPRLETLAAALERLLAPLPAFAVRAGGVGGFPTARAPRVVWVGLADEVPAGAAAASGMAALAAAVEAALAPLGFPPEARPFRPHITLGRVRGRGGLRPLVERMAAHARSDLGTAWVREVVLYQSRLGAGGSRYAPLRTIALGG